MRKVRNLVAVLGDQLDLRSSAFDGFDPERDLVWMAEVPGEATLVFSHKVRIAFFISAMRHFAQEVRSEGFDLEYRTMDSADNRGELSAELHASIRRHRPERVVLTEPGEYRVEQLFRALAQETGTALDLRSDRSFYCGRDEFRIWANRHPQLRMEFFYREMRRRSGVLMQGDKPVGGQWNFDPENRKSFGKSGPGLLLPAPETFPPDEITREIIELVNSRFPNHPGTLQGFDLPVTRQQARLALSDFIAKRLPDFGAYQDAMWRDEPYLYHARISAAMNLKLLDPRLVVVEVEDAYRRGHAPLPSVEGFIRQVIGWREYVRGVYWTFMPQYIQRNALDAHEKLPDLYWDGQTDMNCLAQVVGQTLKYGYAHHIQRLMVTGLFALLFGVDPIEVHKWYLAIYWDAVEWVELPNTTGMSQFADGGLMGSKPYVASGKYIDRMSNYCQGCRYKPGQATGAEACPFTTLYWDFLMRHEDTLSGNQRMKMQLRNLMRISPQNKLQILEQSQEFRANLPKGHY